MKKVLLFVLALLCMFSCLAVLAQEKAPAAKPKAAQAALPQPARWEGWVQLIDKDNSTLTVRKMGGKLVKKIHYDASTKWVSQEHGSKKANAIDPSQVKDGDRVICVGTEDKSGFHATLISKRLTESTLR